ncbi:MAG: capsular polysaccharide biosynthesis protein [Granulosicoccus sp.]
MKSLLSVQRVNPDAESLATNVSNPEVAVALSPGILKIKHLAQLLGLKKVLSPREARKHALPADVVLVWGRKETAQAALEYAASRALPVWYLEDGWIRTSSKNAHSRTCYSVLVDDEGVYYDSTKPSAIERYLNLSDEEYAEHCDTDALAYAASCREALVTNEICKYNYCATRVPAMPVAVGEEGEVAYEELAQNSFVLVVDQTRDDASVRYGAMDEATFKRMLDSAIDENPELPIIVRTHPDVVSGRRQGYLAGYAKSLDIPVVAGDDNPFPWVKLAARVYVGTSQLGYEALLCERPVTIFGLPFYSGWGLADERQRVGRRIRLRNIDEIFHATHVKLAQYCSPMSGDPWQLHQTLAHVSVQKENFRRNARHFHCVGITQWKRRYVQQFLRSPDGSVSFGDETDTGDADTLVTWGFRRYADQQSSTNLPVWRLEDGFIRSAGLGSNFTAPGSLVIDGKGLYFDPIGTSDLEILLAEYNCSEQELERGKSLAKMIIDARVSKYDVAANDSKVYGSADKLCVLVTGQVEDDESIKRGCQEVNTNAALLRAVRKIRPDAWIVYRPHPDVLAGNRKGKVDPFTEQSCADVVDTESSIINCIEACDELHTMTSLSGFEALMRDKRVVTYGAPFYSGWGLTEDHVVNERRSRQRTLDELIYLTLVKYPRYVDIASGEFVSAEQMVRAIQRQKERTLNNNENSWSGRQVSKVVNIVKGLSYAP